MPAPTAHIGILRHRGSLHPGHWHPSWGFPLGGTQKYVRRVDPTIENEIREEFIQCLMRTFVRLQAEDTYRPFHGALLTEEALFYSRLERSFSTSFGQSVVERISKLVCESGGATSVERQHVSHVSLTNVQWEEVEAIVRQSRADRSYTPDWATDLRRVQDAANYGVPDTRRVIADLWWIKDGVEHFMSIKTVKPNLDQAAEAKRDLLRLAAGGQQREAHFGLYYNPYGESATDYAFTPPMRVFNFDADGPVLIGRDYWDTLGGAGTYDSVIRLASEAGQETRPLIRSLLQAQNA